MSYIFQQQKISNWKTSCQNFNSNNSKENDEEEKEPINTEFTEQKTEPYNDENAIEFRWSGVKEEDEEDIALTNFIECLQKKTDEEIFSKK